MRVSFSAVALGVAIAAMVAAGCGGNPRVPLHPVGRVTNAASYRVVDATGPFWEFWRQAEGKPPEVQAELFKGIAVKAHPELFANHVIGIDPSVKDKTLDHRLVGYLASLPSRLEAMHKISLSLGRDLKQYDASFRATFPDMKWNGNVYFTVSIDAFDGALRKVDGKMALLFGIDKIAKIHGADADLGALFHHELFHVYQEDVNPRKEVPEDAPHGVLDPLWSEGLAVYVSKVMHPQATWKQILLSDEMIEQTTTKLPKLAGELRQHLDASTEEFYRDFFLGAGKRADVPIRCGYYMGFRIAERAAKGRTLSELARLAGPELRAIVDAVLAEWEAVN